MKNYEVTKDEVVCLLTQDDYYRRQRKWPLIIHSNIPKFRNITVSDDLFCIHTYNAHISLIALDKIIEEIGNFHPFTNDILIKFSGNLVACGGSICKSMIGAPVNNRRTDDIDFFFYDLDVHQANKMRIEIIEYMVTIWKSYVGKSVTRYSYQGPEETIMNDVKFYIQRNKYVTTLHVEESCSFERCPRVYMYQFIHRIYPDISSIIGGFDLSTSAVAYNGKEIYTTPLGAWSFKNKSIIIDMGRRSTSYEHRLRKYIKYGFNLIFPGLNRKIINRELVTTYNNRASYKFRAKIEEFAIENGYLLENHVNIKNIFSKINNNYEPEVDEYDQLAFYKIQKEKNILKCLILIFNDSHEENSLLNISIKQSNCNEYDWWNPNTYDEKGNCGNTDFYLNKLSDYGNDEKYLIARSDYSHNHMYYKHVPSANATRLRLNNLDGVVSMLYIDNHNNIKEKLINEVDNPNLGINDFVIELYKERLGFYIDYFQKYSIDYKLNYQQPHLIKSLGEFTSGLIYNNEHIEGRDLMIKNIRDNEKICKENLIGIKWITENPGRQWTSSINPIFKDPRDWYGKHYIPVLVGIPPEVESCLRLIRLERTQSYWSMLPKDMFDLILFYVLQAYTNQAWVYI